MGSFDFVLLLLSFVFALALGQALSHVAALLLARERVRFSGLTALMIVNAIMVVYVGWLSLWDLRDAESWDLYSVTVMFVSSILIYLICAAVSPAAASEGPIDMEAFYWKNRRLFYGLYVALLTVYLAMAAFYLQTSQPELAVEQALANAPFFAVSFAALLVRARWAQWPAGVALFALLAWWALAYSGDFR